MSSSEPQPGTRLPHVAPRMPPAGRGRARLTVVPRRRSRAPRVPFVTFVSVIRLAGVVGLLMLNTSMQQASFRETALAAQATDLGAQEEALKMDLQALNAPARVSAEAERLGLVQPTAPAGVLHLGTGEISGDPKPATRGDRLPAQMPGPRRPAVLDPAPVTVEKNAEKKAEKKAERKADTGRDRAPNRNR